MSAWRAFVLLIERLNPRPVAALQQRTEGAYGAAEDALSSEPLDLEGEQMSYEQPLGSPERPDLQPPGDPAGQPSGRHSQGPKPFARFRNSSRSAQKSPSCPPSSNR